MRWPARQSRQSLEVSAWTHTRRSASSGSALIVAAYFANQQGWLNAEDWRFPAANLVGSLLILASLWTAWNFPSAVIEVIWAAISLYGLGRRLAPALDRLGAEAPRCGTAAAAAGMRAERRRGARRFGAAAADRRQGQARGAGSPQAGQGCGRSNSAIGWLSLNGPQRSQS